MKRKEIGLQHSLTDLFMFMAEGNPGGLTVLLEIAKNYQEDAFIHLLTLDDMNIRGTQIWLGFKYHCESNLDKFMQCVKTRDAAMIETINRLNVDQGEPWKAVHHGASYMKGNRPRFEVKNGN